MTRIIQTATLLAALCAAALAAPAPDRGFGDVFPSLVIESIEVDQAADMDVVQGILGLAPGIAVDQQTILEAVERLRDSDLFASVEFWVRPGSERGHVILELEVEPHEERSAALDLRLGTGVSDVDGWYAIPLDIGFQDVFDEQDSLSFRYLLGYRRTGVEVAYIQRGAMGGRGWWGMRAGSLNMQRVYFHDDLEIAHRVDRSRASAFVGRKLGRFWSLQMEFGRETSDPRDGAEIYQDDPSRGVSDGDEVALEDLPASIRNAVDRRNVTFAEASLTFEALGEHDVAHTPASGARLRVFGRAAYHPESDYDLAGADLRLYRSGLGGVFALKGRALTASPEAPFYDRPYLGGLYTVRGVPSQSLSAPEGADWLWSSTLEYRTALSSDRERPGASAVLFVDAGRCDDLVSPNGESVAVGAGWGLRFHLLGFLLGADIGYPITGSPVDESFHANVSVGWTF